ncbi:phosphatase PAP2 family protein [Nocardia sp. NPDC049707]|uniref:phosphatase PAP2 family protein n=1 Tax=Nocardia sp. NPDC049707 TaxID=3154735 RepID=UPI0034374060
MPTESPTAPRWSMALSYRRPQLALLVTAVVLAVAAVGLTIVVVHEGGPIRVDAAWLDWIIAHRNGTLTAVAVTVSDLGDTTTMAVLAVLACAVLAWRRQWRNLLLVGGASAGAAVLVVVGKQLVGRARPPVVDHLVVETNQSYPSGHSLGSAVVLGVLLVVVLPHLHRRPARITAIGAVGGVVVAVGLSRLYLGVHWPTDIAAGWVFGACWLSICLVPYRAVTLTWHRGEAAQRPLNEPEAVSQP